jgi:hypothetical protein
VQISSINDYHGKSRNKIELKKPKVTDHCPSVSLKIFFNRSVPPALERIFYHLVAAGTGNILNFVGLTRHGGLLMGSCETVIGRIFEGVVG